jgi:hypothetical protein
MNDYNLLKSMFKDFKVEDKEIPVEYLKYKGKSKTYVTYTFTDDIPSLFGDDKEIGSVVSIDIDIFSDGNFLAIEEKVKEVMEENNFIRIGCSPDMYEEDTGLYHKTIEFEKERMR